MPEPNIFGNNAKEYWAAGLPVIPLQPRHKRPAITAWTTYCREMPSAELQEAWLGNYAEGNLGLPLGAASGLCMIDIDTDDGRVQAAIESVLPPSPWRRKGAKGYAAVYRFSGICTFQIKSSTNKMLVELLSDGRQVVLPPSIHPDTQAPYEANKPLLEALPDVVALPREIEALLRAALTKAGVDLSFQGSTRFVEYVAAGSRDCSMINQASYLSHAVLHRKHPISLARAIQGLRGWADSQVEKVAGDALDIEKGVERLIQFIHKDIVEKKWILPTGWDDGLSDEDKVRYGFTEAHEEWDYDLLAKHIEVTFNETNYVSEKQKLDDIEAIISRIAASPSLDQMHQELLLNRIMNVAAIDLKISTLRRLLKTKAGSEFKGDNHAEITKAVLELMNRAGEIRYDNTSFYQWEGAYWREISDSEIMNLIGDHFGNLPAAKKVGDYSAILKHLTHRCAKPLVTTVERGVNFANGVLTENGELVEHDKKYGFTYVMPYRYIPELADQCPRWLGFLHERWGHTEDYAERVMALQEAVAATMTGLAAKLQRAILLEGVAASGKSQILKVVRGLMPQNGVSATPPYAWRERFALADMVNKLINVAGELDNTKQIPGDIFKQVVEGEEMPTEYKGKQRFHFKPSCAQWFGSNFMPRSRDISEGFNRRWLILTFDKPVAETQRRFDFGDTLIEEEREAIAAWAMMAFPRLIDRNRYTLPPSHYKAVNEMAEGNDSVRFFINRSPDVKIVPGGAGKNSDPTSSTDLYSRFFRFSTKSGDAKPASLKLFRQRMTELAQPLGFVESYRINQDGQQIPYYENIIIVTSAQATSL
jgi:P4 family phage/plasmid primase-like protien